MGRGPVATVLVQKGTLKKGDIFVVGQQWGKVRALFNDKKEKIEWLGHRPALVDSLPMLGYLDKNKQILVAFGHQHLGLTAGAKTGRIVSDLIIGNDIKLKISNYRPNRFMN